MSLVANASATINVVSVWSNVTFSPDMEDLQAYTGYFNSDDELLNRIWYAGTYASFSFWEWGGVNWDVDTDDMGIGAYTNQMCTIQPAHGDSLVHLGEISSTQTIAIPETVTWFNNFTITNGTSCSSDGE